MIRWAGVLGAAGFFARGAALAVGFFSTGGFVAAGLAVAVLVAAVLAVVVLATAFGFEAVLAGALALDFGVFIRLTIGDFNYVTTLLNGRGFHNRGN